MNKSFYITTAIDYVNGQPHLGHAYEKVIADVIARVRRSLGEQVYFLTGLDEHGQKVQQAAQKEGKESQMYCDELAAQWMAFAGRLNLTNNDFIRTTQPRHKAVVAALLTKLEAQGDLYKAEYRGWYSSRQETFLTDKDRNPDGTWPEIYGEVIELVEHNWYFKMGQHQQWLIDHIEANPTFVQPGYRRNEVLGFLRTETLGDLCISRPKARLNWGIPIPFDPDYVNYVWFDALTNYISVPAAHGDPVVLAACGKLDEIRSSPAETASLWPADIHVIGKDILKFHAVYWPIMLKAMGLPLPKQVLVHGWWQKDGKKISKSDGNVVDPMAVINEWGIDAFRYYVVRELDIGPDGNWTDAGFQARYQAELANGLGNLLNRTISMLNRYRNGLVPEPTPPPAIGDLDVAQTIRATRSELESNQLQGCLRAIFLLVDAANQYIARTEPYKMAKDPSLSVQLDEVLYNLCEICRILAVLLWPFIPESSTRIYAQLGLTGEPDKFELAAWGGLAAGHQAGKPVPLFPRKDA